jgi:hypothetical protein
VDTSEEQSVRPRRRNWVKGSRKGKDIYSSAAN